jgi:hypothetical protein
MPLAWIDAPRLLTGLGHSQQHRRGAVSVRDGWCSMFLAAPYEDMYGSHGWEKERCFVDLGDRSSVERAAPAVWQAEHMLVPAPHCKEDSVRLNL